jgi:hypothetical protein
MIEAHADHILSVMAFIFTAALLPTLYHQYRVRKTTIPLTTVGLNLSALTLALLAYSSLGLWYAATMGLVNGAAWATVGVQRLLYGEG